MAIDLNKGATVELVKALSDDIRTLPDGTKAASAGDAVRRQVGNVKNDLRNAILPYNPFDLLSLNSIATNGTHNGVAYTFSGNQCTITGTSTGVSFKNICDSGSSGLPAGMTAGKLIYCKYRTEDNNVRLAFAFRDANNTQIGSMQYLITDRAVTVPQNAVRFIVRIDIPSGATVNTTVEFAALTELTHDEIIEQLNDSVAGVNTELSKRIYAKNANIYVSDSSITLSDIIEDGFYVISTNWTVTDAPADLQVTALTVERFSPTFNTGFVKQTVESCVDLSAKKYYRFSNYNGTSWSDWHEITSGVTQTINRYENTYNVTANPTITSDTNNYLASTGDTTDVTAAIVTMLTQTGVCHLGTGVFYVSGIDMPDNSALIGSGANTVIILNANGSYAVKMNHRNKVSDLTIKGSNSNITLNENVGTRHGVLWQGDYTQSQSTPAQPTYGVIDSVWIQSFTGGGITCYDTGYGTINFIAATNVNIFNCNAGINISYWSEFHKFTNVRTYGCYYGCINNGGNNTFVNCDFSTCKLGFLMDNTNGQSPNNSHGSAVGCVFNHTDSNNGVGIKIVNCNNGYIFTGCQIWFSQIYLQDSSGIVVSSSEFGSTNAVITVSGGGAVLFANNMHGTQPTKTITNNSAVRFVNCYVRSDGTAVE